AIAVANHYFERRSEVDILRHEAEHDRLVTEQLERKAGIQEAVLDGLRNKDPFVVELIARHRHDYQGAAGDEILPPPLPSTRLPAGDMADIQQDR
ncbi:MAG: hypothetical protein ACYTF0_07015, partial [Planctomycetota bacterium]